MDTCLFGTSIPTAAFPGIGASILDWLAVAAFVTELIIAFKGDAELAETLSGMIMAGATVIAYIVGEGMIDSENKGSVG